MTSEKPRVTAKAIAEKRARIERDMLDPRNFILSDRELARYHDISNHAIAKYRRGLVKKIFHPDNPLNLSEARIAELEVVISSKVALIHRRDGTQYYLSREIATGTGIGTGIENRAHVNQLADIAPVQGTHRIAPEMAATTGIETGTGTGTGTAEAVKNARDALLAEVNTIWVSKDENGYIPCNLLSPPSFISDRIINEDGKEKFYSRYWPQVDALIKATCREHLLDYDATKKWLEDAFKLQNQGSIKRPFDIAEWAPRYVKQVEKLVEDFSWMSSTPAEAWDNSFKAEMAANLRTKSARAIPEHHPELLSAIREMFINAVDK